MWVEGEGLALGLYQLWPTPNRAELPSCARHTWSLKLLVHTLGHLPPPTAQGRATIIPANLLRGCPLVDVLGMYLHKIGQGWGGVRLYRDPPNPGMPKCLHPL